jgi:hypothetical protein
VEFPDANGLTGEEGAEVDLFVSEADASAVGDHHDFVVAGRLSISSIVEIPSRVLGGSRLRVSAMDFKLLLPPRQSRRVSHSS